MWCAISRSIESSPGVELGWDSLMAPLLLRGLKNECDGFGKPVTGFFFRSELVAAFGGEAIEAGLAIVFRFTPIGGDPAALFQSMESGIERALLNLEHVGRDLPDTLGDAVAVDGTERNDFKNEQVEGALQQVGFFERSHRICFLLDNLHIRGG